MQFPGFELNFRLENWVNFISGGYDIPITKTANNILLKWASPCWSGAGCSSMMYLSQNGKQYLKHCLWF